MIACIRLYFHSQVHNILFMCIPHFVSLYVDGRLGCLYLLAVVNNTVMSIDEQLFESFLSIFWIYRNGFVRSYDKSVFSFLRNCQTIFHNSRTTAYAKSPIHTSSSFFTSSPIPISLHFLILPFLSWYEVVSDFDLHFPNDC